MLIKVFIQNEAGSNRKNYHNEKTLEYRETRLVSCPYPYPYGFILGTDAKDGCNLDVFVITQRRLTTGQILECEVIGLMEQFEDGVEDHVGEFRNAQAAEAHVMANLERSIETWKLV
jgi:inorganic pyrophosphatase